MNPDGRRADWKRVTLFFCAILVLTVVSVALPHVGPSFAEDVDTSLSAVLHYAHQHHLQYGTDIVFTYGPLGFLTFFYYYPHAFAAQVIAHFILGFAAASGLCLIASGLRWIWGTLLVLTFIWVTANAWPRTDVIINIALFCWSLLCLIESGRRLHFCVVIFALLAALGALTKVSFMIIGVGGVTVLSLDLLARRQIKVAGSLICFFIFAFLLGWTLAGQRVANLAAFLTNSIAAVQSYSSAMGWEGADAVRFRGMVWAILTLALVLGVALTSFEQNSRETKVRRGLVFIWVSFFLFSIWKHGFVRVDRFHVVMALSFAPVAALALLALPVKSRAFWLVRVLSLACWLLPILALERFYLPGWWASIKQPFASFADHVSCFVMPRRYHQHLDAAFEINRRAARLPYCREHVGNAPVDVFGQDLGYAVVNGFNYDPRPVWQSYFVATARLARLNEQFYLSPRQPEFVLFRFGALDMKIPSLEDGRVLVQLLCNYELLGVEEHFLLLRARASEPIRRTLLAEGTVQLGQPIDLQPYQDANVWLEIVLHPSIAGHLRQLLYRPATLRLAAWQEPGRNRLIRNRAPASMLQAGFLASPLLRNENDVLDLYNSGALIHPGAYTLEVLPGEESLWQSKAVWRAYRLEHPFAVRNP